jgi:hypothetical protein
MLSYSYLTNISGQGYYCEACFSARHPWYRVAHIFGPIYRNENIANSLKSQNHDLQMDRQRIDNYQILDSIKKNKMTLEIVADDIAVDNNLRTAARRSLDLENKMNRLRARLRADVRASGGHIDWDEGEASVIIQKLVRGYKIRRLISRAYADRTMKVWDASSRRGISSHMRRHDTRFIDVTYLFGVLEFYYDKFTGVSSWTPSPVRPIPTIHPPHRLASFYLTSLTLCSCLRTFIPANLICYPSHRRSC